MDMPVKCICKQCGKEFEAPPSHKNRKYCNMNCRNIAFRGSGNPHFGKGHTPEGHARILAAITGRKASPEEKEAKRIATTGEKNPFYGKHHSEETKEKIRKSHEGKYDGDKNPFYGKKHPPKVMQRIADKIREHYKDPEFKARMVAHFPPVLCGENSPVWKGGKEAIKERGRINAWLKRYVSPLKKPLICMELWNKIISGEN